jgi:hypothetical protein
MELCQMDVTASLFLAGGRECKVITGIDDHSSADSRPSSTHSMSPPAWPAPSTAASA